MGRRRKFTTKERRTAYLASGGMSELSGEKLGADFHADHVVPYSRGGCTDLSNVQALTPKENREKGTQMQGRSKAHDRWQRQFVAEWLSHKSPDFLLAAIPGAGKTVAALKASEKFREQTPTGGLLVVCPTKPLIKQWQRRAEKFRWALQSGANFVGTLRNTDFNGVATTYQSVAGNSMSFKKFCIDNHILVVLDEIHHAGDEKSWGRGIEEAFGQAAKRLSLSGTPFRSDARAIPFIDYDENGFSKPDYRYDYPRAASDGVVRIVSFETYSGEVRYAMDGAIKAEVLNQQTNEEDARRLLRSLMHPEGDWVETILRKANSRLNWIREAIPNAGALALCIDINHATRIAEVLSKITGRQPAVIVSDDDAATSSVESFAESDEPWVVAVKQVSEGADIPRLIVECYCTNTATDLFFRQAVGRIVRNQGTENDQNAFCFIPDDPRLIRMAQEIDRLQGIALQEEDFESEQRKERIDTDDEFLSTFSLLGTSLVAHEKTIIDGIAYSVADAAEINQMAMDGGISVDRAAAVFEGQKRRSTLVPQSEQQDAGETVKATEEIRADLQTKLRKKIGHLSHLTRVPHNEIHSEYGEYYRRTHGVRYWPSQDQMTIDQLQEKLAWVESRISLAKQKPRS